MVSLHIEMHDQNRFIVETRSLEIIPGTTFVGIDASETVWDLKLNNLCRKFTLSCCIKPRRRHLRENLVELGKNRPKTREKLPSRKGATLKENAMIFKTDQKPKIIVPKILIRVPNDYDLESWAMWNFRLTEIFSKSTFSCEYCWLEAWAWITSPAVVCRFLQALREWLYFEKSQVFFNPICNPAE